MRLPLLGCLCGAWGVFSFTLVTFFSHRAHGGHGGFKRTVSSPQDSGPSPNPSPAGRGVVCEVTPTGLLVWDVGSLFSYAGETFLSQKTFFSLMVDILFSHRTHRFNRTYLRTVSNSQKASGIQISQNVIAKGGCWVMGVRC